MLDNVRYSTKPEDKEIPLLNNRIIRQPVELRPEELAQELMRGKTFMPAYFVERSGRIFRQNEYWHSQEIVALDIDKEMSVEDALKEFENRACFLYTTFSHSEQLHKFRVVFVLDKKITDLGQCKELLQRLHEEYPMADRMCMHPNRLFFGGKQLFEFNYTNRLCVDDYLKYYRPSLEVSNKSETNEKRSEKKERNSISDFQEENNTRLIIERDVKALQQIIMPEPIKLSNHMEVSHYLKTRDLREFLGVPPRGNFIDVFHYEKKPSGAIFTSSKGNNHKLYKCFSETAPFKGSIFEVTELLLKSSRVEARKFLMQVYNIELIETEEQKALKEEIDILKERLMCEDLEEMYPSFYKVFNRYGHLKDMYIILDLVKEYLPAGEDGRVIFYQSIETIAKKLERSTSATHVRINFLALFEFIQKLEMTSIPPELYKKQLDSKKANRYKYVNSTYELQLDNENLFAELDFKCSMWLAKGCTLNTVNYEGILRNFGRDEADRVFPQDKDKKIPKLNEEVSSKIHESVLNAIEEKGWVTEQEVLDNITLYFKGQKLFKQKQFKICLGEMLEAYNLEKVRLNKKLKIELGYDVKGYPYIIRKVQEE